MKLRRACLFLLILCLTLSAFIFSAAAADETVASGYCGDTWWNLDDEGTLRIWGPGKTNDYKYSDAQPSWMEYRPWIKNIIIQQGVTKIGSYVFRDLYVDSITISCDVIEIGEGAFSG